MESKMATTLTRPADQKWGYPFGEEGLLSLEQAAEFLGNVSKRTVYRLAADGRIRVGTIGLSARGHAKVCRKSLRLYVKGCEK
jgi:hypothetical protein